MTKVKIPYSKQFLEIEIPDNNLVAILESKAHAYKVEATQQEIVDNEVIINHCSEFIASEYARSGVLINNPIHRDMLYAATFEEALERAFEMKGKDAKITVIPDGVSVVVK